MKKFIKKILRLLGWKLIKIKIKKPTSYAFGKPEIQDFEYINKASGILHLGGHRGVEAAVYNWLNKKVLWVEAIPELFDELPLIVTLFKVRFVLTTNTQISNSFVNNFSLQL